VVGTEDFFAEVARLSDAVYSADARIPDRRADFPGVTGCLGDPFSPVWFFGESPSLTQVDRARSQSREEQWHISPGDKLFRRMLAKHGFKEGDPYEPGGWRCYITDVIKSSYFVTDWQGQSVEARLAVAEAWAPVLRYEIDVGQPKVVVALGKTTRQPLDYLQRRGLIPRLPETVTIYHYTYLGSRPQGKLGPMHPERVDAWDAEFAKIAAMAPRHA
jgi:uracil-DNA glycosylase